MIIGYVHVIYVGFTSVLNLFTSTEQVIRYSSICQFTSVYVDGQGRGAQQLGRFLTHLTSHHLFKSSANFIN